ncbi:hypothetical protein DASC09_050030 [Saccharomycopsis crataegensis]|uniref:Armadillo repeat-containing domain-containing protein n=1 Tax=Saccharomycopsis crataegensis TaxID=43959 RepID=A0AAV5QU72_9ASCO|nr:hypothetical protein DASC09_050030 [Saccharomycopsis crataegensis]
MFRSSMNAATSYNSSMSPAEIMNKEIPMLRYSLVGHTGVIKIQKRKSPIYFARLACCYTPSSLRKSNSASNNVASSRNGSVSNVSSSPTTPNSKNGQYKPLNSQPSVDPEYAVARLLELLNTDDEEVVVLTLEAIVITLIDKKKYIGTFIKAGLLSSISKSISSQVDLIRIFSCQTISLIAKCYKNIEAVTKNFLIRPLVELLQDESNEVVLQAIFAIYNIANGNETQKQILIKIGTVSSILILLASGNELIHKFSLGTLAHLASGNVFQKQTLIESSVLISISKFLGPDNDDAIIIETLKVLVNIAKGTNDQKQEIIDNTYLKQVVPLFESSNESLLRKTIQLIQHLANGSVAQKQVLLDNDVVPHILTFITYNDNIIRLYALECVSNLSKGKKSQKKFLAENMILPVINTMILSRDTTFQKQSLQIIQNFSEDSSSLKQSLIDSGILKTLITLINSNSTGIKNRVIKIFENVSTGNMGQVQYLVDVGLISNIPTIMKNSGSSIKKHCLIILSNIVNNNDIYGKQIVIDCGIMSYLKKYLVTSTEYYKPEVINTTFQILTGVSAGDNNQKQVIIDLGLVNVFLPLLNNVNETITTMSLTVINNVAKGTDSQRQHIVDTGILTSLPPLLFSLNEVIKNLTIEILASIAKGDEFNKQAILDIGAIELIKPILLKSKEDLETKKAILSMIYRLTEGTEHQIKALVYSGIFKLLYPLVKLQDKEIINILVCCVENVIFQFCYVKNFVRISLPIIFEGIRLLDDEITIHCLSAISNMTFSVEGQNEVLQYGLLQVVQYLLDSTNEQIKHEIGKIFINISAGDQSKKQALINLNLRSIFGPLLAAIDINTVCDTVWAIENLSKGHERQKQIIAESGILELILPFVSSPNYDLKSRTLSIFANLSEGNSILKQCLIDCNVVSVVKPLVLMFSDNHLKKEIMKMVANISTGSDEQKNYLIKIGYIDILVPLLVLGDENIKQLATLTLSKLSPKLDCLQKQYLIDSGVQELLEPLSKDSKSSRTKRFSQDAMSHILPKTKETVIII